MTNDLLESVKDGVALLTLNRPDRLNALSGPMLDALLEALPRLAAESEVGAIVLTGAGRGFCAGGDVKAMAEGREFAETGLEDKAHGLRSKMEVSRLLHEMPKPTIAMVRGAAAGAGLSMALACDLRVAGESAKFATAFARVGYSGDFGGSWFLTQLVGTAKARELYYTAGIVGARQALALGIGHRRGAAEQLGHHHPARGGGPAGRPPPPGGPARTPRPGARPRPPPPAPAASPPVLADRAAAHLVSRAARGARRRPPARTSRSRARRGRDRRPAPREAASARARDRAPLPVRRRIRTGRACPARTRSACAA